jgi:hypothetical protein
MVPRGSVDHSQPPWPQDRDAKWIASLPPIQVRQLLLQTNKIPWRAGLGPRITLCAPLHYNKMGGDMCVEKSNVESNININVDKNELV